MVAHAGNGWKLAEALIVLEAEANLVAPNRSKASDGSIGDQSHASRASHHNPDAAGYVTALDLTHDPLGGFDAVQVANRIADRIAAGEETRVVGIGSYNYATHSERWFSKHGGTVWSWQDQDLNGASHITHMHLEVNPSAYTSTAPWGLYVPQRPPTVPNVPKGDPMIITLTDTGKSYACNGAQFVSGGLDDPVRDALRKAGIAEARMTGDQMKKNFGRIQADLAK